MDGVFVIDKPAGWTSHDVVGKMRRIAGTRRVGHLGTLDPMATGVLPLVVNRATRLSQFYVRNDKVYDAVVHFGYSTDTYDAEGAQTSGPKDVIIDRSELERNLQAFRGVLHQVPPPFSAKKVGGTPAYKLARGKISVDLKPVEVTVYSLDVLELTGPDLHMRVHCSAGTYLRAIAHELGQAFGCGAFLSGLRRTVSGDFTIEEARTLEELESLSRDNRLGEALIPATRLLPQFPSELVDAITAAQIRQGRDFRVSPFRVIKGTKYVKAITQDGELLAIGEAVLPNVYHPMMVL
jgi:tRNA pseudouridine55 synthase